MANFDPILTHLREQAAFCQFLGSPFTAALCLAMAEDIEKGGPVATLVADWPGDPRRDALGLRIGGYLHHSVLSGAARELASVYPGANKTADINEAWPVAADWIASDPAAARSFMRSPPQTNEVRRSLALLPGFLKLAAGFPGPMHLLELGASAGLNQNWDKFDYSAAGWSRPGESAVSLSTDWRGPPPLHLDAIIEVASRAACDQNPIDASDASAALRLKSYAWPDQPERLARLHAAVALATASGTRVDRADAADWLEKKLAVRPQTGLTVIYHSVFLQYPPAPTRQRIIDLIEAAGRLASQEQPLAWLSLEPKDLFADDAIAHVNPNLMVTRLQTWPGGQVDHFLTTDGHVTRVHSL
jgi:hypothetical protein